MPEKSLPATPVEFMEYICSQEAQILETMDTERSSDREVAKRQEYSAIYLSRVKQEVEFLKIRVELHQRELEIEEKSLQFAKQTQRINEESWPIEKERLEMRMEANEQEMQLLEMKHTLMLMELAAKGIPFEYPSNVIITEPTLALTQDIQLLELDDGGATA